VQFARATGGGARQVAQLNQKTSIVTLIALVVLGAIALISHDDAARRARTPPSMHLGAGVRFTGTLFVISNNDTFAWSNCKIEVNPGALSSGFVYRAARLDAGSTYDVGPMLFANNEGQSLNPLTFKPTSVSISCKDVPATSSGWYYATWN
jgi:hypothetical protein